MSRQKILVGTISIFIIGVGVIVYNGRPVMDMQTPTATQGLAELSSSTTGAASADKDGTYTLAEVATHASVNDCWSAINGGVYDLTSWISRHPGGPGPIQSLCGTDGSSAFTRAHGRGKKPQAALVLLKIGTLE